MRFIFLALIFFVQTIQAEIVSIRSLIELPDYVEEGSLILIDLDHTLIEGVSSLRHAGSFYYYLGEAIRSGVPKKKAITDLYPRFVCAQKPGSAQLLEPSSACMIEELQAKGHQVMGFTHRQPVLSVKTVKLLKELGISFGKNIAAPMLLTLNYPNKPQYLDGVLFIHDFNEKGGVLKVFLEQVNLTPKQIVFVDDGIRHLESVEAVAERLGIPFKGLHFPFHKYTTVNWNREIALLQEELDQRILTNEEAVVLIK